MEKMTIDGIPLLAGAIAFARHIRLDLDYEYRKNTVAYYRLAKASMYYDNRFAKELSIQTVEAYRKALGIILYNAENPEDSQSRDSVNTLFQKGYRRLYNAFKRFSKDEPLPLGQIIQDEMANQIAQNAMDDQLNGVFFAAYYFSKMWDESLIYDREKCDQVFAFAAAGYESEEHRLSVNMWEHDESFQKEVQECLQQIPKDLFSQIQLAKKTEYSGYTSIFDMEMLCSTSLFGEMKFKKEDLKKLAVAYVCEKRMELSLIHI